MRDDVERVFGDCGRARAWLDKPMGVWVGELPIAPVENSFFHHEILAAICGGGLVECGKSIRPLSSEVSN
jgi:hypothetical protein